MSIDGKLIAITGVTGSHGGATARRLLQGGWRVRGLTRNADSAGARAMAAAGVELLSTGGTAKLLQKEGIPVV